MLQAREIPFIKQYFSSSASSNTAAAAVVWPRWSLLLVAAIAVIDVLWLSLTPLSLGTGGSSAVIGGLIVAILAVAMLRTAEVSIKKRTFVGGLALILAAWPVLRLYNHLVMSVAAPFADPMLSAADQAIGFDWLAYARWVDAKPQLLFLMNLCYRGLTAYSIVMFVLVLMIIGAARAREFVLLFIVTAVAASTLGMFFPAEAAMIFYDPAPGQFHIINGQTGTYHAELLDQLRGNPNHVLSLDQLPGLTTFPSFHTAMGILCIWCARGSRALFPPMLIINAVMIASTPVLGSHYLIDIFGGILLAATAIWLLRKFDRAPLLAD